MLIYFVESVQSIWTRLATCWTTLPDTYTVYRVYTVLKADHINEKAEHNYRSNLQDLPEAKRSHQQDVFKATCQTLP